MSHATLTRHGPPGPVRRFDPLADLTLGFVILLAFLAWGELLRHALDLPIPGNVLGMVFLSLGLLSGVIRLAWIERAADALLSRLGLFFVPPGVAVMLYWDLIRSEWLPLFAALLVSTFLVLLATGALAHLLERGDAADDPDPSHPAEAADPAPGPPVEDDRP